MPHTASCCTDMDGAALRARKRQAAKRGNTYRVLSGPRVTSHIGRARRICKDRRRPVSLPHNLPRKTRAKPMIPALPGVLPTLVEDGVYAGGGTVLEGIAVHRSALRVIAWRVNGGAGPVQAWGARAGSPSGGCEG
jgi:hypothetical protein